MILELYQPPPNTLNTFYLLGEIAFNANQLADLHPNIDTDLLRQLADGVRADRIESEDAIRALCQCFQDTFTFEDLHGQLQPGLQAKVLAFIDGTPAEVLAGTGFDPTPPPPISHKHGLKSHLPELHRKHHHGGPTRVVVDKAWGVLENHPVVYEDEDRTMVMEVHSDLPFLNWQQNVETRPSLTFVPKTVYGLQNLVKTCNRRIRCSGTRHSRDAVFADNGDVLVSFVRLSRVSSVSPEDVGLFAEDPGEADDSGDLRSIQIFPPRAGSPDSMHVRVGTAVTSAELRECAVKDGWSLPVDVSADEITVGGLVTSICHGSGLSHKTVNDYIRSIEYVDANGAIQTISDPKDLCVAAGCFGLLGIITHVTFEVKKMAFASMKPRKVKTMLAVPPLDVNQVPEALRIDASNEDLQAAIDDFERRAGQDYYCEWTWLPYQSDVLVNTWSTEADGCGAEITAVIVATDFYADIPARWQTQILAISTMAVLSPLTTDPEDLTIKTAVPNAFHFRRGRNYARTRNVELEIAIPSMSADSSKPDWTVVRKVWWGIINLVYASASSPMRLALEMRITGDSNMVMAPQRGNSNGTLSIELGTVPDIVTEEDWGSFCQQVTDMLFTLVPQGKIRPHWGKEWSKLHFGGQPAREYIKTYAYKAEIPEFLATVERIGEKQGWKVKDLQQKFSNKLLDEILMTAP